jgi:hypothetical protein
MATGLLPFRGDTSGVVFNAILEREPIAPVRLNPDLPPRLEEIICKALEKDRNLRYQHAADLRADLQRFKRDSESGRKAAVDEKEESDTLAAMSEPRASVAGGHASSGRAHVPSLPASVSQVPSRARSWKTYPGRVFDSVAIAAGVYFRFHQRLRLTEKDTIVLSDFTTAGISLGRRAVTGVDHYRHVSPFLNILPDQREQEILRQMGRSSDEPVSKSAAREVCQRANAQAVLAGSIARLGDQYLVGLEATNCNTGELLAGQQVQADKKDAVLKSLGQAASGMREKLGESLGTIQRSTRLRRSDYILAGALKAWHHRSKDITGEGADTVHSIFQARPGVGPELCSGLQRSSRGVRQHGRERTSHGVSKEGL